MTRLTILVAICLISMCHEVQASSLLNNNSNVRSTSSLSSKPNNSKSNTKSSKQSSRKQSVSKSDNASQVEEPVVLTQDQMAEVEEVKKFIEQNAPIFDRDGKCYYDMVSLPKGTYFRSGKEFKVE